MNVSRAFLKDFALVATFYEWDAAKIESTKEEIRADPARVRHWQAEASRIRSQSAQPATVEAMRNCCTCCAHFSMRHAPPAEAAKGYGRCLVQPVDVLMRVDRDVRCRQFRPTSAETAARRREWFAQHLAK